MHEVVALVKQDNMQRFIIAGSEDDPRSSYYSQPVFPLWVRAAHGHNIKLQLDDKDIAVPWLTLVSSKAGPLAPCKGRRAFLLRRSRWVDLCGHLPDWTFPPMEC